jgi:hypothetical protein
MAVSTEPSLVDAGTLLTCAGLKEFFSVLSPYFSPPTCRLKFRAYFCFLLLGLSKACTILAPIQLATAVDALTQRFPLDNILAYIALRIGAR